MKNRGVSMETKLSNVNQNSISLKKNSKGLYEWEIKLYFSTESGAALQEINLINEVMKKTYGGGQ